VLSVTLRFELIDQIPMFLFEGTSSFYCRIKSDSVGVELDPCESVEMCGGRSGTCLLFRPWWTVVLRCHPRSKLLVRLSVRRRRDEHRFDRFGYLELDLGEFVQSDELRGRDIKVRKMLDPCMFNGVVQFTVRVDHNVHNKEEQAEEEEETRDSSIKEEDSIALVTRLLEGVVLRKSSSKLLTV
jgi:hypothetical protein